MSMMDRAAQFSPFAALTGYDAAIKESGRLTDEKIEMDTLNPEKGIKLAEDAIRPFAVGRKNWLFCDTVQGAESSAITYSMVEIAKVNGIDPYDCLLYMLSDLPYCGKSVSHDILDTGMPGAGRFSNNPAKRPR